MKSLTEQIIELMGEEKKDLPKKLPNPFYPQEGEKYLKMEGNINFMEGYNKKLAEDKALIPEILSLIRVEVEKMPTQCSLVNPKTDDEDKCISKRDLLEKLK